MLCNRLRDRPHFLARLLHVAFTTLVIGAAKEARIYNAMGVGDDRFDLEYKQLLVDRVKALQRSSPELKQQWYSFCKERGTTHFDPGRHDSVFLKGFLNRQPGGERMHMGTGPDPGRSATIQRVKSVQKSSPAYKEVWWNYCASRGSYDYDPARHDESFLRKFLEDFESGKLTHGRIPNVGAETSSSSAATSHSAHSGGAWSAGYDGDAWSDAAADGYGKGTWTPDAEGKGSWDAQGGKAGKGSWDSWDAQVGAAGSHGQASWGQPGAKGASSWPTDGNGCWAGKGDASGAKGANHWPTDGDGCWAGSGDAFAASGAKGANSWPMEGNGCWAGKGDDWGSRAAAWDSGTAHAGASWTGGDGAWPASQGKGGDDGEWDAWWASMVMQGKAAMIMAGKGMDAGKGSSDERRGLGVNLLNSRMCAMPPANGGGSAFGALDSPDQARLNLKRQATSAPAPTGGKIMTEEEALEFQRSLKRQR
eukprot:TRINITY_DN10238_c1_g1_i1.p1 TRINITY_DN10238_c1_g1~~TRINITY_DN10238_c1_g1_i1.p1  ORF type:complete len:478 (+),score=88.97 TRINITY_DN10238_c1_g1_i1:11-1444(+)